MTNPSSLYLSWLGCGLEIRSDDVFHHSPLESLRFDFSHLISGELSDPFATILVADHRKLPKDPRWGLPLFRFRGVRVSANSRGRWIRYPDGTVVQVTKKQKIELVIYSDNATRAREHLYLFTHALLGEGLERRGYIRMHAMSFAIEQASVALMAVSGIGKSTITLQILEDFSHPVYSDEITLLKAGLVHAFPCRIALELQGALGSQTERTFRKKSLLQIPHKRIAEPHRLRSLYFTTRSSVARSPVRPPIRPIGVRDSIIFLTQFTVGWHLPQIIEVCLRADTFLFVLRMLARRFSVGLWLLLGNRVHRLELANGPQAKMAVSDLEQLMGLA